MFGRRLSHTLVATIGVLAPALSFLLALMFWGEYLLKDQVLTQRLFDWFSVGDFNVPFSLVVDPLSILMSLIVTGVGSLIHLYSIGYMHGDLGFARYFSYLNLFVAAMMILVLGNNLVVTFVGWEGVGLCSYLLIGFWFEGKDNVAAGKKAFIVNRIGDFGFLLGIMLVYSVLGTLDFSSINEASHAGFLSFKMNNLIALALFVGAIGKSAQIPLYVWLPDAMAGPTPVSALIHAATMVTAGVFMIARLNGLYFHADIALSAIAAIGALTAFFAATIALVQTDIKKVLAYSTVSQLGFMFVAVGVGAFSIGIFHLMTHAFFKACLFLGSGSIIHALAGEQDLRNMGGLRKAMPVTFVTFLISTLAIAGFPLFAGFFSKDEIIWNAFASVHGSASLWIILVLASLATSFYMFRIVFLAFFGDCRLPAEKKAHLHESPFSITLPLALLGILSLVGGFVGVPHILANHLGHIPNYFEGFLKPVFNESELLFRVSGEPLEYALLGVNITIAFFGALLAFLFYRQGSTLPMWFSMRAQRVHVLLKNKYYIDELYDKCIVHPLYRFSEVGLFKVVDRWIIDFAVNGVAKVASGLAFVGQKFQTGQTQTIVLFMWAGIIFLIYLLR
jgi:NADH-quinone oxidoreductase subunit L